MTREACDACTAAIGTDPQPAPYSSGTITASAQRRWSARTVQERIAFLKKARLAMAAQADAFLPDLAHLPRTAADSLTSEVLPLLDAMRFLERQAHRILSPQTPDRSGRPLWLSGVHAEIRRDPLGHILVIGPSNFPLFLPGAQVMQALAAGNAVTWKPGTGGFAVAQRVASILAEAGLPRGILRVTGESIADAQAALADKPDKVVFTGSHTAGAHILRHLADSATPAVMELSGSDAVVVLPSADAKPGLEIVARAVAFGLRLNGGQVCMSPRRLFATRATLERLKPTLLRELAGIDPVPLSTAVAGPLRSCLENALANGASVLSANLDTAALGPQIAPILVDRVTTSMPLARTDLFAPVLSLIEIASPLHAADAVNDCPFGLTASIFGDASEAATLADALRVGTVLINDLIAPTADPRVPFAARGASGFGATRGAEGLLEMTAVKTVLTRRGGAMRHLEPNPDAQVPVLTSLIRTLHAGSLGQRWQAVRALISSTRSSKLHR